MTVTPQTVLDFWYQDLTPKDHYTKSDALDKKIDTRFRATHAMLVDELSARDLSLGHSWTGSAAATLAAIIVLDQFSRNIFRDTPGAFASDDLALSLSKFAIGKGWDIETDIGRRSFFYLPFMHSENAADQAECVTLFKSFESGNGEEYALRHQVIIERFGRFPHRNAILSRQSTPEETIFLAEPNSSF